MKDKQITVILLISTAILSIISLFIGVLDVTIAGVLTGDFDQLQIMLISRLPRLLAILCTGDRKSVV